MSEPLPFREDFSRALLRLREEHPLPAERCGRPETAQKASILAARLARIEDREWPAYARTLPRSDLALIFPAYAQTAEPSVLDRLDTLALAYTSWTLYEHGWAALQDAYPNRRMQLALATVFRHLQEDPARYGEKPPYLIALIGSEVSFEQNDLPFLRGVAALLQEALSPAEDDKAVNRLYEDFAERYCIQVESRFAASLLALYWSKATDRQLYMGRGLLAGVSPWLGAEDLALLLERPLRSRQLDETERAELLRLLLSALDTPVRARETLSRLSGRSGRQLTSWRILDTIKRHYQAAPVKADFMLTRIDKITDVARLSPVTAAFHFTDFTIVDNLHCADHSYFYPDETLYGLLDRKVSPDSLGEPDFPYRTIIDPKNAQRINGVLQLSFTGSKRELSERFIDLKLSQTAQRFHAPLNGRWDEPASMRERLDNEAAGQDRDTGSGIRRRGR